MTTYFFNSIKHYAIIQENQTSFIYLSIYQKLLCLHLAQNFFFSVQTITKCLPHFHILHQKHSNVLSHPNIICNVNIRNALVQTLMQGDILTLVQQSFLMFHLLFLCLSVFVESFRRQSIMSI